MWDTAELQTDAAILGIPHPPGSPLFALLGYVAVHVLPFGEAAWRVNVFCSLCVAIGVALAYATARAYGASVAAAAVGALGFAFALIVWRDATRAETLDLALVLRAAALLFALHRRAGGSRRDLFGAWFCAGLACATHGLSIFLLPALGLVLVTHERSPQAYAIAGCALALGLLPYAYLPLRSNWIDAHHLDPLVARLGLPPGQPFWNYGNPANLANFFHVVTGSDFHVRGGFAGYLDLARYPHDAARLARTVASAYGYVGTMLALGGAVILVASREPARIALVLAALLPVPYTESYFDLQDPDRYYGFALWCAAVAMAVGFERLAAFVPFRRRSVERSIALATLVVTLGFATPERANIVAQRTDRNGPNYVADVLSFTPNDAIVLADWSYATPLAYAGYVDGAIGRRTVVASSPRQYLTDAARWVRSRPVYFVGFDDDLRLPGWHVRLVRAKSYYGYRLTK